MNAGSNPPDEEFIDYKYRGVVHPPVVGTSGSYPPEADAGSNPPIERIY